MWSICLSCFIVLMWSSSLLFFFSLNFLTRSSSDSVSFIIKRSRLLVIIILLYLLKISNITYCFSSRSRRLNFSESLAIEIIWELRLVNLSNFFFFFWTLITMLVFLLITPYSVDGSILSEFDDFVFRLSPREFKSVIDRLTAKWFRPLFRSYNLKSFLLRPLLI